MKKHFFVYLIAALCLCGVVTSCSDDDPIVCPVEETVFNSQNGLELTYSGEKLLGKQVVFTPNALDGSKATLTLSGLAPASKADMPAMAFPASGVIPGEVSTTLNVDLLINGDAVSFEGTDEVNGRSIAYKGSASKSSMKLDLNVTMPQNVLSGKKFQTLPYAYGKTSPITIEWLSDATFPFLGDPKYNMHNLLTLLQIAAIIPVGDQGKCMGEALNMVFSEVSFLPDGNIQAQYKDTPLDAAWKTSPLHMAQYVVDGNKLRVFINVEQILAFEKGKSRADVSELISSLMGTAAKFLVEGVPVSFKEEKGVMQFYLDEETLLPIFQMLIPYLKDEAFVKQLVEMISGAAGPDMAPLIGMIVPTLLKAMPDVIEQTTDMHFGLNMQLAQ